MRHIILALTLLLIALPSCQHKNKPDASETNPPAEGGMTRSSLSPRAMELLEEADASWREEMERKPGLDAEAVRRLGAAPAGAHVTVYLGLWCPDSRRELTRFWHVIEEMGGSAKLPFEIEYISLDGDFQAPGADPAAAGVRAVPTFIVTRDGEEVGRVIETANPHIETELAAILSPAPGKP